MNSPEEEIANALSSPEHTSLCRADETRVMWQARAVATLLCQKVTDLEGKLTEARATIALMMTQNEELQKGKIFADDLMHVASASCERMAKERIELLCQLQQAKAAVRADSSKSVPEGWEPSKDCVHALRTGDGVWLRNEGMQFFRQGDWYGLSPLSNGTPSVKGCTYRILIEKGAK